MIGGEGEKGCEDITRVGWIKPFEEDELAGMVYDPPGVPSVE